MNCRPRVHILTLTSLGCQNSRAPRKQGSLMYARNSFEITGAWATLSVGLSLTLGSVSFLWSETSCI